ncbi:MAG: LPS assembly lipoprotein LptE [Proteobacteria bacterium]|nr:LPS assembly lipoprotein LptE [Pseudomonadota bacterium]MDA1356535.1 LPS assembly lipoprotein LptE [Pseudomonadota bacterium]
MAILASMLVTGCGFTPIYSQDKSNSVRQYLPLVEVAKISGHSGLLLRNRLNEKLSPKSVADVPQFRLSIDLESSTQALLIQSDNTATRQNLRMRASFALVDLSSGATVFEGNSVSVGSYNVVGSEFATISAEDNAAERAAQEIGKEIFDLLVVYFNRKES